MAIEKVFPGVTLQRFRDQFQSKHAYKEAIREMDLKERAFDWKPTSQFERMLKAHLIDKALVKTGSGMLKVTSYRLGDTDDECSAYVSYGGRALQATAEGRDGDMGFFLTARPSPVGLTVSVQSKRDRYVIRKWAFNIAIIAVGLIAAVIPGLLIAGFVFFVEPRLIAKKVERNIWPPLAAVLTAD